MKFSDDEKKMLAKVHKIGLDMANLPDKNLIFVILSPHLGSLMELLKRLEPFQMQFLFMQYGGVMKVMRMIDDCVKEMKNSLY